MVRHCEHEAQRRELAQREEYAALARAAASRRAAAAARVEANRRRAVRECVFWCALAIVAVVAWFVWGRGA